MALVDPAQRWREAHAIWLEALSGKGLRVIRLAREWGRVLRATARGMVRRCYALRNVGGVGERGGREVPYLPQLTRTGRGAA